MKTKNFLISIMAILAAMFMLSSCEKTDLPEGTGTLIVNIYDTKYDSEVKVFPYGMSDQSVPIAEQAYKAGSSRTITFTLNVGDYIVECGSASLVGGNGSAAVQIQAGKEVILNFSGK